MDTLNNVKMGQKVTVSRVKGKGELKRRLIDMGFVPGVEVFIKRVAPLGDPLEIKLLGYSLSLRKKEAAGIVVDVPYSEGR